MKLRLGVVFFVTIVLLLIIEKQSSVFFVKAQGGLRLRLPFDGIHRINSYVDHDTPDYDRDGTITFFNDQTYNNCPGEGEQWNNEGPYCYDGHEGIDWAIGENTPVLAAV